MRLLSERTNGHKALFHREPSNGAWIGNRLLQISFWRYSEKLLGDLCTAPGVEGKWCRRSPCRRLAAGLGFGPDDLGSQLLAPLLLPVHNVTSLSLVSSSIRSLGLLY